jgi:serine/threonine-protein kinase PknG
VNCERPDCIPPGSIVDGYCDECGRLPLKPVSTKAGPTTSATEGLSGFASNTATGTRQRSSPALTTSSGRRLGAGLVQIPPVPARDPAAAVMVDPQVAEHRRFCAQCSQPVGRRRGDAPGRTEGFCRKCGHPFCFTPKLHEGELVAGQYEVIGCLAHGGLGWIYLARDLKVSFLVVLKGLLNRGDEEAMAVALAERRFLAEVEHPNIVKIHNFVEHDGDGYIVMEYIGGSSLRAILESRREANGGKPDPLPVEQAIAYMVEILPAMGHLHDLGLLYCDFKPDNVIQTASTLKLIDLGGVYRMDDRSSPIYGTKGYQAPEIAESGPSVTSDLFTVARTLAVLCTDFRGYQSTHSATLADQEDVPVFATQDSLYKLLERATATNPDDRFQSADEMGAQLLGVLREVVAEQTGRPAPGTSTLFTPEGRGSTAMPDRRALPVPLVSADDPSSGFIASIGAVEPDELIETLRSAPDRTSEVELMLARTLLVVDRVEEALAVLARVEASDPWEWRTAWYRGVAALGSGDPAAAAASIRHVYRQSPGELAPKLALGYCAESAGDQETAAAWYEIVSRTDPAFTSAAFGLARCRLALGDRAGAIAAYERVPETSSAYVEAQIAEADVLLGAVGSEPDAGDVVRAARIIENLTLGTEQRARLSAEILETSLPLATDGGSAAVAPTTVLGHAFTDHGIRMGLESTYRLLARHAGTTAERIALVDRANEIRPRTLL